MTTLFLAHYKQKYTSPVSLTPVKYTTALTLTPAKHASAVSLTPVGIATAVSLTPAKNASAVSLIPVNIATAVSLTPVSITSPVSNFFGSGSGSWILEPVSSLTSEYVQESAVNKCDTSVSEVAAADAKEDGTVANPGAEPAPNKV